MPCEDCNIQFTVFKRKRSCSQCKRYFCSHCLIKRNQTILCRRCAIFTKRPLTKSDLLCLKTRDLLYFLQSKNISTAGHVEKEELANLILTNTDLGSMPSDGDRNNTQAASTSIAEEVNISGGRSSTTTTTNNTENCTNPFDQWKQTCQNFFTSFTDRISNDLGFDNSRQHPTTLSTPLSSTKSNQTFHKKSKDIVTVKIPMPSYYESMNKNVDSTSENTISTRTENRKQRNVPNRTETVTLSTSTNTNHFSSSSPSTNDVLNSVSSIFSPLNSSSSMSSQSFSSQPILNNVQQQSNNSVNKVSNFSSSSLSSQFHQSDSQIGFENIANINTCDCSDDEVITEFNIRQQEQSNIHKPSSSASNLQKGMMNNYVQTSLNDFIFGNHIAGPSSSVERSELNNKCLNENSQIRSPFDSSGSSFEELGAVGGGGTVSDNENWQMIHEVDLSAFCDERNRDNNWPRTEDHNPRCSSNQQNTRNQKQIYDSQQQKPARCIIRRRSDSFVYRQNQNQMEIGPSASYQPENELNNGDRSDRRSHKRIKKCCSKCGKSKKNIEEQIEKFKRQLESSVLTQCEIRENLNSFVNYLEQRAMSIDCSDDSEAIQISDDINNGSNDNRNNRHNNGINSDDDYGRRSNEELQVENNETDGDAEEDNRQSELPLLHENASLETSQLNLNDSNDGIYVYAEEDLTEQQQQRLQYDTRFINIKDFKSSTELDNLRVKQIKRILTAHRVDFTGACEKRELLERLKLLWNEIQSRPEVKKLSDDDLCKVCMDAPIECILLECGHMATCTKCGKILTECPICRRFIVRVVRCFRA